MTQRDTNRRAFPFEWGLDWLGLDSAEDDSPLSSLRAYARDFLSRSPDLFRAPSAQNLIWNGSRLTFQSPLPGLVPANSRGEARIFESEASKAAVVVLPQWNADEGGHVLLCKLIQKLGMTAVRYCLPYHENRRPPEMLRADLMVSPNIGRTFHAIHQAVLELRQIVQCLREQGYERIGVMGTSVGSCVAYLAFVHDPGINVGVFNHVSAHFADVVWRGLATRYVRWGLDGRVSLEDLRDCWAPISPVHYVSKLAGDQRPHLMITAKYDLTFLPELTELVVDEYRRHQVPLDRIDMPCGHYTMGHFPYSWIDGWHVCTYLRRHLALH